jgi:hypothetical protein
MPRLDLSGVIMAIFDKLYPSPCRELPLMPKDDDILILFLAHRL